MTDGQLLIHVRFSPDGTVAAIGERPAQMSAQAWFDCLSEKAGTLYQPLSGGRGVFRIGRGQMDTLKTADAP